MFLAFSIISTLFIAQGQKNPSNCKDMCTRKKCNQWAVEDHPCAARKIDQGIAIDPWRIGDDRCQETNCQKCGDEDFCVQSCEMHLTAMRADGFVLGDFPDCRQECSNARDSKWMCFIDSGFPDKDNAGRPICYHLWKCLEAYCSAVGPETCYARENIVDPWNVLADDDCKEINCRRCGNHQECVDNCNRFNDRKFNQNKVDCAEECRSVKGYKCLIVPDPRDDDEDANSVQRDLFELNLIRKKIPHNKLNQYSLAMGLAFLSLISVAFYLYRHPNKQYEPIE